MAYNREQLSAGQRKFVETEFPAFVEMFFPGGNIPSALEIQEKAKDGTMTVREGFIARMYVNGLPVDNVLLLDPETQAMAEKLEEAFPDPKGPARNIPSIYSTATTMSRQGFTLDSSAADIQKQYETNRKNLNDTVKKAFAGPLFKENGELSQIIALDIERTAAPGSRKPFRGNIPIEALDGLAAGIKNIPEGPVKDAVIASLIGYRGTDLSGMRTSEDLATLTNPARPYYDEDARRTDGTVRNPMIESGAGRKGKGKDRPVGPLIRSILDKRYDAAGVTGEMFPDIKTATISNAFNKYVWPEINARIPDKIKNQPRYREFTGFTDVRRVTAAAIANHLGNPTAAGEILSHGTQGLDDKIDKTMTGFYIDVEDVDAATIRRNALVGFEKLLADAVGAKDVSTLSRKLNTGLVIEFNADYPELDVFKTGSRVDIPVTPKDPEEIALERKAREASTKRQIEEDRAGEQIAAEQADETTLRRAEKAEDVAAAQEKIAGAQRDAKFDSDVNKGNSAIDFITNMAKGKGGDVLESAMVAAPLVADTVSRLPMVGGAAELGFGLFERSQQPPLPEGEGPFLVANTDPYEQATLLGAAQAERFGLPPALGKAAGAAAEFFTGAPSAIMQRRGRDIEYVEPSMLREARQSREARESRDEFGNLDPDTGLPPQPRGMLEAGNAPSKVREARGRALRGETTSMLDVQPQTL